MKKYTIAFSAFLLLIFTAMLIYTALSPDFAPPVSIRQQAELSEDNPIWDKTLDDLADYFVEEQVLPNTEYNILVAGNATDARLYSGVELYWWDLEHLTPKDKLFKNYQNGLENGFIQWTEQYRINVEIRGPFAVGYYGTYAGDMDKMLKAFRDYCRE